VLKVPAIAEENEIQRVETPYGKRTFSRHGVVEYIRSEEAKLGLRSQSDATETAQAKSCPQCRSIAVVRVGSQQRCSQCGLQWGKLPQVNAPVVQTYSESNGLLVSAVPSSVATGVAFVYATLPCTLFLLRNLLFSLCGPGFTRNIDFAANAARISRETQR